MTIEIGFIGGGNMAQSLIGGLIADGRKPATILVSDPLTETRDQVGAKYGVPVTENNRRVREEVSTLVFAVKPQVLGEVAKALPPMPGQLVITIAAGIRQTSLDDWLGGGQAIVRAMPNTPALIGEGITGLYANHRVTPEQRQQAEIILGAVGEVVWCGDEDDLDTVTAVSGSGPAYVFLFMEILERNAREMGLNPDQARKLAVHTTLGAARLARHTGEELRELRRKVTSPGGTTEAALTRLMSGEFDALLSQAIEAARERSRELSRS